MLYSLCPPTKIEVNSMELITFNSLLLTGFASLIFKPACCCHLAVLMAGTQTFTTVLLSGRFYLNILSFPGTLCILWPGFRYYGDTYFREVWWEVVWTIERLFCFVLFLQHPGFQHGGRHQVQMILLTFSVRWTPCNGLLAKGQPMRLQQGNIAC